MIMEIIGIILSTFILLGLSQGTWSSSLASLLDFPTLFCILILTVPALLKRGLAKDFLRAFKLLNEKYECSFSELRHALDIVEMMQKQILYAGYIVAFQGFWLTLRNTSSLASIGPNLNVAMLAIFYTAILELLMLPLQIEAKRRIVDYMDKEQDSEKAEREQDAAKA